MSIFIDFINRVGIIMILAFSISRLTPAKMLLARRNINTRDKLVLSVIFGIFGIVGTYTGIYVNGGYASSRIIGVFVGGLLGGPLVGLLGGLIAAFHRLIININGLTTLACTITTVLAGVISGYLNKDFYRSKNKILLAYFGGVVVGCIEIVLILILSRPFSDALNMVKVTAIPTTFLNSMGIAVFIAIIENIINEDERIAVKQVRTILKIATDSFSYFRKGFNAETALENSKVIQIMADFDGIVFTDKKHILSSLGRVGNPKDIRDLSEMILDSGKYAVSNTTLDYNDNKERLGTAIAVPLKDDIETIGALILYKIKGNSATQVDLELAIGLGDLFSTQIALSKLEYNKQLLAKAEFKALQSQINPHFLFNSINTIAFCADTEPKKARELLLHLGECFRRNLQQGLDDIDLYEEIEHVKSYIEIEKVRFGHKLEVIFDIPKDLNCKIPPLILQPIVENAINHGIFERLEGGTVYIKAIEGEDYITLVVEDDGVGIEEAHLNQLLNEQRKNDSIGLINVNKRLGNQYGEGYGLNIQSTFNEGTIVTMKIPKVKGGVFQC